ncbi:hypothetical protein ACVCAH_28725 [Micromonospora sp. LZ34]
MSAGGFSEVDHDLLADYVGGALDGTPEEATVARLVAEDPAWSAAHALLAPAVADVRAGLAGWGEAPEPMPPTVTDRILAALAAQPIEDPAGATRAHTDEKSADPAATDPATADPGVPAGAGSVVPAQPVGGSGRRPAGVPRSEPGRGAATGPGRRRRRLTRLAGPVAVAAVSIAAVGLGVNQLAGGRSDEGAAGTAMSDSAETRATPEVAGPAAAGAPDRTTAAPLRSGTDYTPETLGGALATKAQQFQSGAPARVDAEGGRMAGPGNLDRLGDQAALTACLGEIGTEHGAGPLLVEVVDYARFLGQPALVVRFTDDAGARWAWVSGPECGVPGSGADTRYRTRVG